MPHALAHAGGNARVRAAYQWRRARCARMLRGAAEKAGKRWRSKGIGEKSKASKAGAQAEGK